MQEIFKYNGFSDKVVKAYYQAVAKFRHRENVTAVDIGYKNRGGNTQKRVVIRVHVREKIDPVFMEPKDLFPKQIGGVTVDVLESNFGPQEFFGSFQPEPDRQQRFDTPQPGISIGDQADTVVVRAEKVDHGSIQRHDSVSHVDDEQDQTGLINGESNLPFNVLGQIVDVIDAVAAGIDQLEVDVVQVEDR